MPSIMNLGVPGTSPGITQPKQVNRYIVTFQGIGGLADGQGITRNCVSAAKPTLDMNPVEVHRYNTKMFIAGKYSWSPIDLQIDDDISNEASIVIRNQIDRQIGLVSSGSAPLGLNAAVSGGAYKFTTILSITTGGGSDSGLPDDVIETWVLEGCWFTNVTWGELNWEDDSASRISISLSYDHAYQELNNSAEPASGLVG